MQEYKFRLKNEQHTAKLAKSFANAVRLLETNTTRRLAVDGKENVGKSKFSRSLIESLGVSNIEYDLAIYKTYTPKNSSLTIKHMDAHALSKKLKFNIPGKYDHYFFEHFKKSQQEPGLEIIEWGQSNHAFNLYQSLNLNYPLYDFAVFIKADPTTAQEIKDYEKTPSMKTFIAMSPLFKPRTLTLSCDQKHTRTKHFETFLEETADMRLDPV